MNRDDALDLLGLHAAGDLDEAAARGVEAAAAADPAVRAELTAYARLEDLLEEGLRREEPGGEVPAWLLAGAGAGAEDDDAAGATPAEEEAEDVQTTTTSAPALVRRRCPYCRDGLDEPGVPALLCAACATPQHAACFAENGGCALFGCESSRAVDSDTTEARQVCASCEGLSPAEAPFCAWCAAPLGAERRPARRRSAAGPWPLGRYLAAAGLLLAGTIGMGAYFGLQQESAARSLERLSVRAEAERTVAAGREVLAEIHRLRRVYVARDLDGDGVANAPPALGALRAVVTDDLREELGLRRFGRSWDVQRHYELVYRGVPVDAPADWIVVEAVPTDAGADLGLPTLTCDVAGRVRGDP